MGRTPSGHVSRIARTAPQQVEVGVKAPEVLVVEHDLHAGVPVDPEHVRGAEVQVVVLEHQTATDMLRKRSMPQPNGVRSLGDPRRHLRRESPRPPQGRASIKSSISAWVARSQTLFFTSTGSGLFSTTNWEGWKDNPRSSSRAFLPSARRSPTLSAITLVELGHVGMCDVGRQIGRHPVHVDPVATEVVEDLA